MLIAAIIAVFIGWTGAVWHYASNHAEAAYKEKQEQAEAKIKEQADQIIEQGKQAIVKQQQAFDEGTKRAQVVTKTITVRGQSDVQKYPVFSNPVCVLPPDSLQFLRSARANMLAAADPGFSDATLSAPGADSGRQDGNPLPADAGGREPSGTMGNVHAPARPADSGAQVPRSGVRTRPKPQPVVR